MDKDRFSLQLSSGQRCVLHDGTRLQDADVLGRRTKTPQQAFAQVEQHPTQRQVLGLKNLTQQPWIATVPDGTQRRVPPGRSIRLAAGTTIDFGSFQGNILVEAGTHKPSNPAAKKKRGRLRRALKYVIAASVIGVVFLGSWPWLQSGLFEITEEVPGWTIGDLASLPPVEGNGRLVTAGHFWPSGATFPGGARVTLPLSESFLPGTPLWVVTLDPAAQRWIGNGEVALVAPSGREASGFVYHFSTIGFSTQQPSHLQPPAPPKGRKLSPNAIAQVQAQLLRRLEQLAVQVGTAASSTQARYARFHTTEGPANRHFLLRGEIGFPYAEAGAKVTLRRAGYGYTGWGPDVTAADWYYNTQADFTNPFFIASPLSLDQLLTGHYKPSIAAYGPEQWSGAGEQGLLIVYGLLYGLELRKVVAAAFWKRADWLAEIVVTLTSKEDLSRQEKSVWGKRSEQYIRRLVNPVDQVTQQIDSFLKQQQPARDLLTAVASTINDSQQGDPPVLSRREEHPVQSLQSVQQVSRQAGFVRPAYAATPAIADTYADWRIQLIIDKTQSRRGCLELKTVLIGIRDNVAAIRKEIQDPSFELYRSWFRKPGAGGFLPQVLDAQYQVNTWAYEDLRPRLENDSCLLPDDDFRRWLRHRDRLDDQAEVRKKRFVSYAEHAVDFGLVVAATLAPPLRMAARLVPGMANSPLNRTVEVAAGLEHAKDVIEVWLNALEGERGRGKDPQILIDTEIAILNDILQKLVIEGIFPPIEMYFIGLDLRRELQGLTLFPELDQRIAEQVNASATQGAKMARLDYARDQLCGEYWRKMRVLGVFQQAKKGNQTLLEPHTHILQRVRAAHDLEQAIQQVAQEAHTALGQCVVTSYWAGYAKYRP